jgi:hypothetical protein
MGTLIIIIIIIIIIIMRTNVNIYLNKLNYNKF